MWYSSRVVGASIYFILSLYCKAMSPCVRLHLKISLLGNYVELSPCAHLRLGVGVCLRVSGAIVACSDSAHLEAQTRAYTMCTTRDSPPRVACLHTIWETFPLDWMVLTMGPKVNISVDHLELLTELVRQHPCIYDPKDPDHNDAIKVANIWASIRRVLQEDYQGWSAYWLLTS